MIVGLVGFAGSGKGFAGEIIAQEYGYKPVSFGAKVKDICAVMFGWPREFLEGDTKFSREFRELPDPFWSKKFGRDFTPREAMQQIGTQVGRQMFHPNFWVDWLENIISPRPDKNYVITDVRFPNEIEFIKKQGGLVIEIQRGINPDWYDGLSKIDPYQLSYRRKHMDKFEYVHESEWLWVGCSIDTVISNNGTREELAEKLGIALTNLR